MFQDHHIMGVCRLYPMTQNKQSNDWCGQFVAITGKKVEEMPEVEEMPVKIVYNISTDTSTPQIVARIKRKYERKNVQTPA
jgi:hypothetical protein